MDCDGNGQGVTSDGIPLMTSVGPGVEPADCPNCDEETDRFCKDHGGDGPTVRDDVERDDDWWDGRCVCGQVLLEKGIEGALHVGVFHVAVNDLAQCVRASDGHPVGPYDRSRSSAERATVWADFNAVQDGGVLNGFAELPFGTEVIVRDREGNEQDATVLGTAGIAGSLIQVKLGGEFRASPTSQELDGPGVACLHSMPTKADAQGRCVECGGKRDPRHAIVHDVERSVRPHPQENCVDDECPLHPTEPPMFVGGIPQVNGCPICGVWHPAHPVPDSAEQAVEFDEYAEIRTLDDLKRTYKKLLEWGNQPLPNRPWKESYSALATQFSLAMGALRDILYAEHRSHDSQERNPDLTQ